MPESELVQSNILLILIIFSIFLLFSELQHNMESNDENEDELEDEATQNEKPKQDPLLWGRRRRRRRRRIIFRRRFLFGKK